MWSDYEESPGFDPTDPAYFAALRTKTMARLAEGESEADVRDWLESLNLTPYEYEPIVEASLCDLVHYFQRGYTSNWYFSLGCLLAALFTLGIAAYLCFQLAELSVQERVILIACGVAISAAFGGLGAYFFVRARWFHRGHARPRI